MRVVWVAIALCSLLWTQYVMAENLLEKDETGYHHLWSPFQNHIDWKNDKGSPFHHGADEYAGDWNYKDGGDSDLGMPVYPVFVGKVIFAGDLEYTTANGVPKEVVLRSNSNKEFVARYSHLCDIKVKTGDMVSADTLLGYVGKTGTTAVHLHLVLYEGIRDSDVDSFKYGNPGRDPFSGDKIVTVRLEFDKLKQQTDLTSAKGIAKRIVDLIAEAIDAIKKADANKLEPFKDALNNRTNDLESIKTGIDLAIDVKKVVEVGQKALGIAELNRADLTCGTCVKNIARAVAFAAPYKLDVNLDVNTSSKRDDAKGCGVEEPPTEDNNENPPNTGEQDNCLFSDIDGEWYQNSIETLCKQGIAKGYDGNLFKPENPISRVEFLKMVLLAKATKEGKSELYTNSDFPSDFNDIDELQKYEWAYPYINYAKQHEIMTGYGDDTFKPSNTINRAEAAKVAVRAEKGKDFTLMDQTQCTQQNGGDKKPFDDVGVNVWFCREAAKASELRLFQGEGDAGKIFNPGRPMNRAEGAKVACRILNPEGGC